MKRVEGSEVNETATPPVHVGAPRVGLNEQAFVGDSCPPLSWKTATPIPAWVQARAEIAVNRDGTVTSVQVDGPASVHVAWPFLPIGRRESVRVRVRVHGEDGSRSPWSEETEVTGGFLEPAAWRAHFIGSGSQEPHLLRGYFDLRRNVRRATLYATALGAYDVEINGSAIDEDELKPGWTSYQWRLALDVTDVTTHLRQGRNAVGITLAGGWYTERYGFRDAARRFYEGSPAAAAQLVVEYEDDSEETFLTDERWRWQRGPVVSASLYQGETYDARLRMENWSLPSFDDATWPRARLVANPGVVPTLRSFPPVRVIERLPVQQILTTPSGRTILDFGQNLVGRLRIRVTGESGHTVTLRHAEVLENGELGTRPLRNAAATDHYTLQGDGEEIWEPKWTVHGFRYAEVENWPGSSPRPTSPPRCCTTTWPEQVASRPPRTPSAPPRQRGVGYARQFPVGAHGLPATGRAPRVDGGHPGVRPDRGVPVRLRCLPPVLARRRDAGTAGGRRDRPHGRARGHPPGAGPVRTRRGMGRRHHRRTGRPVGAVRGPGRAPGLLRGHGRLGGPRRGTGRRELLWEDGLQFGDWLDPDAPPDQPGDAKADADIVATAYFFRSAELTAEAAALTGRDSEAARYASLAERIALAFRDAYVTPDGRMMSDAPTAYALAICFALVHGAQREAMGRRLSHLVRASGYRISTGFVGTPIICEALTSTGHAATASRLLTQTECPSWLYTVTMGATTIWERWDSMLEDGSINPGQMTSFNHYALGGVADWLHRTVAGLAPAEPGYRVLRMAPTLLDDLDDASAWHETPFGRAVCGWRREGGAVRFHAEVPPNSRALVELPSGATYEVGSGVHDWVEQHPRVAVKRSPLSLSSSLATIIDDREAYADVLDAMRAIDPERAEVFRRSTRWTPGRELREPLNKAPLNVLQAIEKALAALPAGEESVPGP